MHAQVSSQLIPIPATRGGSPTLEAWTGRARAREMAAGPGVGGREYTVSCAFKKAVPDLTHQTAIRDAVLRVQRCTFAATELLNLYVRDRLENHDGTGLDGVFTPNWLLNAYNAVSICTSARRAAKIDPDVKAVFDAHMADPSPPLVDRAGLTQTLIYECKNLAAVGSTNVWMHFSKRVLAYTRTCHALDEDTYKALSKDERRARKLALMQASDDVCRPPAESKRSPTEYHAWVDAQRVRLGIDAAVGEWKTDADGRAMPLLYHLKARPQRFLKAMHTMSLSRVEAGRRAFALFPLRRRRVPRHIRFDMVVLDKLLQLGCVDAARKARALDRNGSARQPKRKRDDPTLIDEKKAVFNQILDLRAAGVRRRHHFAFAFTTDGESVHLNMSKPKKDATEPRGNAMPTRGMHSIDALKHLTRLEALHVVGIDPGKRELVVAVDRDDPRHGRVVRYTLPQRRRDMRIRQYAYEMARAKPNPLKVAEEQLSKLDSKAPALAAFAAFASERRRLLAECPDAWAFYDHLEHRHRRRKSRIKAQRSEAQLYRSLFDMHPKGDQRQLVLAYGSWGLVAGRPNMACNKRNPPAVGVGLMKRLAKRFLVVPTPEQYTSKTCVACMGPCGPHPTLKTKRNKEIRGLRVCQNEGCGLLQNRDKTGARNIGLQFERLLAGKGAIRDMTDEEIEFHRLNLCLECDS